MNQSNLSQDNAFSPLGRFGRLSYLAWMFLSSIIGAIILGSLMSFFSDSFQADNFRLEDVSSYPIPAVIIFVAVYLLIIYFNFVFIIRRLHDRSHSGWLSLLILVPLVNLFFALYLLFAKGDAAANQFGPRRVTRGWEKVLGWIYILLVVFGVIAAMLIPSYQSYILNSQSTTIEE